MRRYLLVASIALVATLLFLSGGYALLRSRPQPDARMLRARALVDTENYLSALEELRAITASKRDATEVHSYLGAAYMQLHLYKAAIDEFEQATRQSPRTMDAWLGLAATHIRLGDGQRALEDARKAADLAKDSTESWLV